MSTHAKSSSKNYLSFLHHLNVRFPWLKIISFLLLFSIALLDIIGVTISRVSDSLPRVSAAPMLKHVRVTERDVENRMLVALTFDDGPSSATTPILLDVLKNKEVPATFFMLGSKVKANPDIVRRVLKEGHEIGSHTFSHQNLIKVSVSTLQYEINQTIKALEEVSGRRPTLLRPPYGNFNDNVRNFAGTPLIFWSVDTLDWKNKNTDSIVNIALEQIHEGAIILMHDIYPTSVEAVPVLIDALRKNGYEFVTVSELAKSKNVALKNGGAYYNFRP